MVVGSLTVLVVVFGFCTFKKGKKIVTCCVVNCSNRSGRDTFFFKDPSSSYLLWQTRTTTL